MPRSKGEHSFAQGVAQDKLHNNISRRRESARGENPPRRKNKETVQTVLAEFTRPPPPPVKTYFEREKVELVRLPRTLLDTSF